MRALFFAVLLSGATVFGQAPIKMALPCPATTQEISASGRYVAVRCKDHSAYVLEVPSGKTAASLPANEDLGTFGFSRDDHWMAAGNRNGDVVLIGLTGNSQAKRWSAGTSNIEFVKFIAPGALVVSPVRGPAAVWDVSSTPTIKARLDTDFASITATDVSPDGKLLVTTGADTVVRFYDTENWTKVHDYRELMLEPFAAAFSSDGKYAIIGGADGQLTILDAATGKKTKALPPQADPVSDIRLLGPDRFCVAYFDADGIKPVHLLVWNADSGTSTPVTMSDKVTGGGVINGQIWLASAAGNELELRVAQ